MVGSVAEDVVVEIEMEESENLIPAANYTAETDDAVVSVDVPDGAFTEEVDLKVTKIKDEGRIEALKLQANSLLEEGQVVAEFLAYDVSFVSKETGDEAEPAYTVSVNIQVKKPMVSEDVAETEAIGVSVLHLPEDGEAKVVASTEKADETEFAFEADSFSPYGVALLSTGTGNKARIEGTGGTESKEYATLQEAINASKPGDVIVLLDSTDENIKSDGKEYTLDMQGRTLRCGPTRTNVYTINGGNVTIKNGTITGGDRGGYSNQDGKGLYIASAAEVTLENCVITENIGRASGGIHVIGNSELTLTDCRISENTGSSPAGGITAENSTVTVNGGSITGNKVDNSSESYSGGICVRNGVLNVDGTAISDNINGSSGIYVTNTTVSLKNAVLTANKLKIENTNQAISFDNVEVTKVTDAFAVSVKTNGTFEAKDCKFHDNTASGGSYGLPSNILYFVGTGTKTLTNCQFTNNRGNINPTDTTNSTVSGPVRITAGDAILNGCTFSGNSNWKYGAIYSNTTGIVTLDACQITDNSGTEVGGIYVTKGTMNVTGSVIKNNAGVNKAGGVWTDGSTSAAPTFTMTEKSALYNNQCEKTNSNDVNIGGSWHKVTIQKASEMSDGDFDFTDYRWSNLSSALIDTELTAGSNAVATWNAVQAAKFVARINGKDCETLTEALTAAKDGDTIDIIASYVPVRTMFVVDKEITINMNGATIAVDNPENNNRVNTAAGTQGVTNGKVVRGGIFKVTEGGTLNLAGTGTMGNRVIMAGGVLNFNGNVFIKLTGSSDKDSAPVAAANYNTEVRGGTVNINSDMDFLKAYLQEGRFNVDKNASINKLDLQLKAQSDKKTSVKAEINGSVTEMVLSQSLEGAGRYNKPEDSQVILNSPIESLTLTRAQDANYKIIPVTKAGSDFSVNSLNYKATINAYYDQKTMANPTKEMDDIVIIEGNVDSKQINLANAIWTSTPTKLTWNTSDGGDGKDYKFLITVDIGDKGIVLRKNLPTGEAVFLDGKNGKDTNDGKTVTTPVKTFAQAKTVLKANNLNTIYVIGTVSVAGTSTRPEEWSLGDLGEGKMLKRYVTFRDQMISVPSGRSLTLKNIVIDGGAIEVNTPIIRNAGTLNIGTGAVLQNNINTYSDLAQNGGSVKCEGGAVWNSGTLKMSGGTIANNSAVSGSGVFTQGAFELSGGEITGNKGAGTLKISGTSFTSPNGGGGVFVAFKSGKMTMSGGTISNNSAMAGGGISLGNLPSMYYGGTLTMTGGALTGNTATNTSKFANEYAGGGGIFVQMDSVADITGGSITENHSAGGMFGGGGIYVNGGKKKDYSNGLLRLKNVKVSENSSRLDGGGLAACPSSGVEIYLTDGGLIHGNNGGEDDIFITSRVGGYYGTPSVDISRYMMGGGVYGWRDTQTKEPVSSSVLRHTGSNNIQDTYEARIYSPVSEDKITADDKDLAVFITDNTSDSRGGGIGTNGDVIIGTEDDTEKTQVKVTKKWKLTENGPVLTDGELNEPGSINDMFQYTRVYYTLWGKYTTEGEDAWQVIDRGSSTVQPNGKWFVSTFANLDLKDAAGNEWMYKVTEDEDDLFTGEVVNNGDGTWTVTNTPAYSLKISKKVVNMYEDEYPEKKTFTFSVTLKDKEGNPFTGDLTAINQDDEIGTVSFTDGEARVELADNESIWIKGIPAGSVYSVTEDSEEDYETSIKIITNRMGNSTTDIKNISNNTTEDQTIVVGVNDVTFTNSTKAPHGSLVISKTVAGNGDLEREWNFAVELFAKNETDTSEEDTKEVLKPETGKIFNFTYTKESVDGKLLETGKVKLNGMKAEFEDAETGTLQDTISLADSQRVTIDGLPVGASYEVSEIEANQEPYQTTVENALGTIKENKEVIKIDFINTWTDNLKISKQVEGTGGDQSKAWHFEVKLENKDESGSEISLTNLTYAKYQDGNAVALETGTVSVEEDGKLLFAGTGNITLTHGQYVKIDGLPGGIRYQVTETEANQDNYSTAVFDSEKNATDGTGIIKNPELPENQPNEVNFVNTHTPPENPPYNPPGGGGGGGGSTPPQPRTTIDTPEVPLANFPSEPVTELIEETEVPLVALPKTGDSRHAGMLLALFGIAGLGALFSAASLKKNKEDD